MKRYRWIWACLALAILSGASFAGDLNASCTGGITQAWDQQFSAEGNLVQLIWAGPNGKIDPPNADGPNLGAPTGDDVFIRDTYIGHGYLAGYAYGRFDKLFSHSLIQPGAIVYLRAWDVPQVTNINNSYGNSELYQIQTADEFESHDFAPFAIYKYLNGETHPVELSAFNVAAVAGRVIITWTTQSESQNLGFHIFKSQSPTGQKIRANKEMIKGAINSATRQDYSWEEPIDKDGEVWYYWLADVAVDGTMRFYGPKRVETIAAPKYYSLEQNYPNPFNPSTTITFNLKEPGRVQLSVFNLRGQLVKELVNEERVAGQYSVEWNGLDGNGLRVPSGLYFYSIRVNEFTETKKMALTK
ncbi:MAG: T9SS type A sorting domain-containing protein [candidate division KSB1 bacterium]|nr:T9SS type A sorting domain-containing protein [candidate division KSB1 bacterium]